MKSINLDGIIVGQESDCYVIAEVGHNHKGDIEVCKQIFKSAKECGASAVKLQKRDNKSLYTQKMYDSSYNSANSYGKTYGLHREALEFNIDQYKELQDFAKDIGISFFATPFDIESVDFLEKLNLPYYKVSSSDLKNIKLVKYIAQLQKPMIISTGGCNLDDVTKTYNEIKTINSELILLQCVSSYPADYEDLNLSVISTFRKNFPDTIVGFSSHDSGVTSCLSAYHLGARVFEKHFTLNRAWKGTDHSFSLEPRGLSRIVRDLKRARISLGSPIKFRSDKENAPMRKMEKIIVAKENIKHGSIITEKNICLKIPDTELLLENSIDPDKYYDILGKKINTEIKKDEPIRINFIV